MSEVKNTTRKGAKKGSTKGKKATAPKVVIAQHNKRILNLVEKSSEFVKKDSGSWDRLGQTSRLVELDRMSMSKAFKEYLKVAKTLLTPAQMAHLTFAKVSEFAKNSQKFGQLEFWTINNIKLLCNAVLKANDANTARGAKVAKQGGQTGKKADAQTRRGANTK
jgi:hypothetical protein